MEPIYERFASRYAGELLPKVGHTSHQSRLPDISRDTPLAEVQRVLSQAKGGRALAVLKDGRTDEVKRVDMGMLRVYAGIWSSSFACVDVDHWQLLPLEEKEPVPVDHGTQKGQDIKAELAKRGMEAPLMSLWLSTHIRQKLLFGQVPTMDELLQWWEDTSGERIEHGKRCERCQCSGKIKRRMYAGSSYKDVPCDDCQGSGYSVRPTWMGDSK